MKKMFMLAMVFACCIASPVWAEPLSAKYKQREALWKAERAAATARWAYDHNVDALRRLEAFLDDLAVSITDKIFVLGMVQHYEGAKEHPYLATIQDDDVKRIVEAWEAKKD